MVARRQINTDRNLRLQYLAGMWLNSNIGERILSSILAIIASPNRFSSARRRLEALSSAGSGRSGVLWIDFRLSDMFI